MINVKWPSRQTCLAVRYPPRICPIRRNDIFGLVIGSLNKITSSIGPHGQASASSKWNDHHTHAENNVNANPMLPCLLVERRRYCHDSWLRISLYEIFQTSFFIDHDRLTDESYLLGPNNSCKQETINQTWLNCYWINIIILPPSWNLGLSCPNEERFSLSLFSLRQLFEI